MDVAFLKKRGPETCTTCEAENLHVVPAPTRLYVALTSEEVPPNVKEIGRI